MLNLYPNHIFYEKVLNQITHRKNKLWRFLPSYRISLAEIGSIPDKVQFQERVLRLTGDVTGLMKQVSIEEQKVILQTASQTLSHEFDYLGSGKVQMQKIRWHEDFKTGNAWQKGVFYLNQRRSTKKGADIKVPWELSRGHHLLWLGEAYLITKDDMYAQEIVDEIEDWLRENPFMYSVNWTCTMDVAIRSVNWIYAVALVLDSPTVIDSFIAKLYRSLYQHAWFIYNNLEQTIPYSNNHFFSDLAGLTYLSLLFDNTKRGGKWKDYVVPTLYEEIRRQVLPSGVHYERSVSYHRLMTEMILASLAVIKRNGINVPTEIEYRACRMLSYIDNYTKPNHLSPLIEDNDDGRFLPFIRRDFRCHDYLLNSSSAEMLFTRCGVDMLAPESVKRSKLYGDAGHAILRVRDVYLFVTNGEQSSYESSRETVGTHTHNDKLSFELSVGEDDLIVDPGAYIYTPEPEKRNEFRSTKKHNTVVVDGEEQNEISPNNVFLVKKNSRATMFVLENEHCVEGEYSTFKLEMTHRRRFELRDNSLLLTDRLTKEGSGHQAICFFHLADNIKASVTGNEVIISSQHYDAVVGFSAEGGSFKLGIVKDTISPSYGVLRESKTICLESSFADRIIIKTQIIWQRKK